MSANISEEMITLYVKETPEVPIACSRLEYYENGFTTFSSHYPAIIEVFLFNRHGDMLLQKRARHKRVSPGKLHSSVGGHISWGEVAQFSVVHECMEELGAPAMVFTPEAYQQAVTKLGSYTHKAALLCEFGEFFRDYRNDPIERRRDIKDRIWLYFGRYDGPLEIPDRASAGYEWIELETLEKEFQSKPEAFTEGLKAYVEVFGGDMRNFIQKFCLG